MAIPSKLAALAACCAVALTSANATQQGLSVEEQFARFKAEHGKVYATEREEGQRLSCFRRNLGIAARRNEQQRLLGFPEAFGITRFADLCPQEFQQQYLSSLKTNATRAARQPLFSEEEVRLAQQEAFDWRAKGAVTPVGDEGQCGSTWAWAAVDTMEAQWFLKGNKLTALSVQQVNSCDPQSQGCNGGLMDYAYQWVLKNKGIDSAADYPYTSGTGNSGTCNKAKLGKRVAHFSNYTDLPTNEGQILAWVAKNGPVAVAVNAVSWQQYTGGVMTTCDPTNVDHAVSLVGYTPQSGSTPAYWIVKNMWGVKWGEAGYIRLAYGQNTCGLTAYPGTILA